jgi:hypothetical protein
VVQAFGISAGFWAARRSTIDTKLWRGRAEGSWPSPTARNAGWSIGRGDRRLRSMLLKPGSQGDLRLRIAPCPVTKENNPQPTFPPETRRFSSFMAVWTNGSSVFFVQRLRGLLRGAAMSPHGFLTPSAPSFRMTAATHELTV